MYKAFNILVHSIPDDGFLDPKRRFLCILSCNKNKNLLYAVYFFAKITYY